MDTKQMVGRFLEYIHIIMICYGFWGKSMFNYENKKIINKYLNDEKDKDILDTDLIIGGPRAVLEKLENSKKIKSVK